MEQARGRGQVIVRLTDQGKISADRWRTLQNAAEARWRVVVGADQATAFHFSLRFVVSNLPLEHPHYPASYGAADASITGGNGQDWKPVRRTDGGANLWDLPVAALISQIIVAFAIGYEQKSPVALSLSAAVLNRIPPNGRMLKDLGDSVGVSALHRHGFVRVSNENGSEVAYLTEKGRDVSEAYVNRVGAVEADWRLSFGEAPISQLRLVLEQVFDTNREFV